MPVTAEELPEAPLVDLGGGWCVAPDRTVLPCLNLSNGFLVNIGQRQWRQVSEILVACEKTEEEEEEAIDVFAMIDGARCPFFSDEKSLIAHMKCPEPVQVEDG